MASEKKNYLGKNFLIIAALTVIIIAITIAVIYSSPPTQTAPTASTTTNSFSQGNCGDIQISINSMVQANGYYNKFGDLNPASSNYSFEIMDLTFQNLGSTTQDLSGHKLEMTAGNSTYIPFEFSQMTKLVLPDNSVTAFDCNELNISSGSRFVLSPGQSDRGCKAYQILNGQIPVSLSLFDSSSNLKCTIQH